MVLEQKAKDYDRDLQIINRAIEEKLKLHDRLNKQLTKLIEMAGGNEDDPLQRKVRRSKNECHGCIIWVILTIDHYSCLLLEKT